MLKRLVGGREADVIVGDLREEFEARGGGRLWYWRQVLSCFAVRLSPYRLSAPDLFQDFHLAARIMRRNPGYALTAMVCLGLGIGVNATVFTMVHELFWRNLPVPESDRVVAVTREREQMTCSWRDYLEFERRSGAMFAGLTAYDDVPTSLDAEGSSQIVMGEAVTANFANVLRIPAQAGRWFTPEDDRIGAEPVAVISDGVWTERFGRSPEAIGKRIRIEAQRYRVVGVAPPGFVGVSPPHTAKVWTPFLSQPYVRELLANGGGWERPRVRLFGRLAPGVRVGEAQAGMRVLDEQLQREFPRERASNGALLAAVAAGASMAGVREVAAPIATLLFSVTGVVLLIACVNVANLLLSRSAVRRHEMAVRRALGASWLRLVRQTFCEGLTLASGGAVVGVVLAYWTNRLLASSLPALPHIGTATLQMNVDWRVAGFALCVAALSAVAFSIAPALEQARPDPGVGVQGGSGGSRPRRQRDFYVIAQVALSLTLLIAATLLVRALGRARDIDPGFQMDRRLAARIYISEPEYTPDSGRLFFDRVMERVQAVPGVGSATLSYTVPLNFSDSLCVAAEPNARPRRTGSDTVVPGYFGTLGIPLVRGRQFEAGDREGAPKVAVVNETLAQRFWPGADPIGKTFLAGCDVKKPRELTQVVGVAKDAKYESLDESARPFVYRPLAQNWVGFMAVIVETQGNAGDFVTPLRAALRELDPNLRIYEVQTLREYASESLWKVRWEATLLGSFGALGMLLAAVGLYGVVAYTVAQRTREIGIRIAVGAQPDDVMWMVLGRGLALTGIGVGVGVLLSAGLARLMAGLLYGMSPFDPTSFGLAATAWTAMAMLASWVPARRAMRVDPVVALRWE